MNPDAKTRLREWGGLMEFETSGITYPAISGHPDIFFCQTPSGLCVAPGLSGNYYETLQDKAIGYFTGSLTPGAEYPHTVHYCAVVTGKYFIHNLNYTDPLLLKQCDHLEKIHVNQGYTRCNLLALGEDVFLSSDRGIFETLKKAGLLCYYFEPEYIRLEGFRHGFLGGTCGIYDRKLYIYGNPEYHSWGKVFQKVATDSGFQIISLAETPLQDCGSILFI